MSEVLVLVEQVDGEVKKVTDEGEGGNDIAKYLVGQKII